MMKTLLLALVALLPVTLFAQKKPLDHSVYDGWQSIGERMVSNDGNWILYTVTPQEGDSELKIQSADGSYKISIARGYNAVITEDSRFAILRIKPFYKDTRDARIKKKKADDMPKDSIAIVELGKDSVWRYARVKNYKVPEKQGGWVAYHLEKAIEKKDSTRTKKAERSEKTVTDSLNHVIDSLRQVLASMPAKKKKKQEDEAAADNIIIAIRNAVTAMHAETDFAEGDEPATPVDVGTDLVVRSLYDGKEKIFSNVLEYLFSKEGGKLVLEQARNPKDTLSKNSVVLYDLATGKSTTLSRGGNDFKGFAFSDDGSQVAWVAERDAKPKELQKFYKLWYYKQGMDSAQLIADKSTPGMQLGMTVSEFGNIDFSKSGKRLMFGTAPIQPPKDTTLVDIDLVKLDIWHYNDDYLQTQQLYRLQRDMQINYLAIYHVDNGVIRQLGSVEIPLVYQTNEGDGERFVGVTDFGRRVEGQWAGNTKKDIYAINPATGEKILV